jgi:pimeloyl-ACP methyl ester carboxylesterase
VAVGLGLRHTALVRALVPLEAGDMVIDGVIDPWEEDLARAVEEAAASDPGRAAEAMFRSVLGDAHQEAWPDDFNMMVAGNSWPSSPRSAERRCPWPTRISRASPCPTLLVSGEDSLPAFRAINDRLAASIPGARTTLVGGGHLIDPGEPTVLCFVGGVLESAPN